MHLGLTFAYAMFAAFAAASLAFVWRCIKETRGPPEGPARRCVAEVRVRAIVAA
jgi:hypothetical protein